MTDVFLSYAHEDQDFVRLMVRALEADGLSVWWDHTIPPGQSWDTFIARGIREAKCAIVVWSRHSVESEWVKEEATVARGGQKYLPVQIDGSDPPMGFTRIQAANLVGWTGDTTNPQWRMLASEAGKLARAAGPAPGGPSVAPIRPPPPPMPPPPAPSSSSVRMSNPMIGVGVAAALVLVAGGLWWTMTHNKSSEPEIAQTEPQQPPAAVAAPAETKPAEAKPTALPPSIDQDELDRLKRENKELAAQRDLAQSKLASAAKPPSKPTAGKTDYFWLVGVYKVEKTTHCTGYWDYQKFSRDGDGFRHNAGPSTSELTYNGYMVIKSFDGVDTWNAVDVTLTRVGSDLRRTSVSNPQDTCYWRRIN